MLFLKEPNNMLPDGFCSRLATFGRLQGKFCEIKRRFALSVRNIQSSPVVIHQYLYHFHLKSPYSEMQRCLLCKSSLMVLIEPPSIYTLLQLPDVSLTSIVPYSLEALSVLISLIILLRALALEVLHPSQVAFITI